MNSAHVAYTGPLWFGTPLAGAADSKFMYDTGSSQVVTTSTLCTTDCTQKYFDPAASTSYMYLKDADDITYGSG